ncbi:ABC transporter ATP-binding protein [Halobacillus sp. MO56]
MENIIEVKRLMKTFGNHTALRNVNIQVKKGETFGLLGPSGSGKTTTIKILSSQLQQTSGEVNIFGMDTMKLRDPAQMRRIGILTDNSGLYSRLTVYDNLALYCNLYDVNKQRIDEVLHQVNLLHEKNKHVQKLSKGMKQRVTLARSILHKPDLLFLDEPTSALDPVNRKRIHKIINQLNREGTTVFLTTHDMYEAEDICDRVAFLDHGEIKLLDTPQKIRTQFADPAITILFEDNSTVVVDKNEEGAEKIYNYMKKGEVVSIHSVEPNLGDVFVQLTGRDLG